jgi:hypothetical protein
MAVPGETAQALTDRLALGVGYTKATSDAIDLWTCKYRNAYNEKKDQLEKLGRNKHFEYALCQRQIKLYKERMEHPPSVGVNIATLNNPAAARAALRVPLFNRSTNDRSAFWQVRFDADVFASFMKGSKAIVDLR